MDGGRWWKEDGVAASNENGGPNHEDTDADSEPSNLDPDNALDNEDAHGELNDGDTTADGELNNEEADADGKLKDEDVDGELDDV